MLGHNETQLDSYNKNAPQAHGISSTTQAHSLPIGLKKECTEIIRDRQGHSPKLISPKNMMIFSSLEICPLRL